MILILGGTREARALASRLSAEGIAVTTSLAGRTDAPLLPDGGAVRVGGFGGADGLARWLTEHGVTRVVDATHPYATRISATAEAACAAVGVPIEKIERPGFTAAPGDDWRWVDDLDAAAALARGRVFLTTGRLGLEAFADADAWFLVRCITAPSAAARPPRSQLLLERGPFTLDHELALIDAHRIDLVITKDSGGDAPKLAAARRRGLPVIVVRRPPSGS